MTPLSPYLSNILSMKYCSAGTHHMGDDTTSPLAAVANVAARTTTAHVVNMVATEWPRRCARAAGGPAPPHHTINRSASNAPRWSWLWRVVAVVVAAQLNVGKSNSFVCLFITNKFVDRALNHWCRRARHSKRGVSLTFTWRSRLCWRLAAGVSGFEAGSNTVTDNVQYLQSRRECDNHSLRSSPMERGITTPGSQYWFLSLSRFDQTNSQNIFKV